MCRGDTFCRCDIEEEELRQSIIRAKNLLRSNGYFVLTQEQYRELVKEENV